LGFDENLELADRCNPIAGVRWRCRMTEKGDGIRLEVMFLQIDGPDPRCLRGPFPWSGTSTRVL